MSEPTPAQVESADQPDGISSDSFDLPTPSAAAGRVKAFVSWFGDGRVMPSDSGLAGWIVDPECPPLYARDLEALARAALTADAQVPPESHQHVFFQERCECGVNMYDEMLGRHESQPAPEAAAQVQQTAPCCAHPKCPGGSICCCQEPAPEADEREALTCRTFDDHGDSICDRPARFVVWGHLYEKRYKGPKCARHVPPGVFLPGGFGAPAIYEIPARRSQPAPRTVSAAEVVHILSGPFDGTEGLDSFTLAWAIAQVEGITVEAPR